ncbi:hypothetical protein ABZ319_04945 [Nocardia sp. NPDC005978]
MMETFIIVAILAMLLITPTTIALTADSAEKKSRARAVSRWTARRRH